MAKKYVFLVFFVVTISFFFWINVRQSVQCRKLAREITLLEEEQKDLLEQNKEAAAVISKSLATAGLEEDARKQGLVKKNPQEVFLINITGGKGSGL